MQDAALYHVPMLWMAVNRTTRLMHSDALFVIYYIIYLLLYYNI